jgi:hypothetical protein
MMIYDRIQVGHPITRQKHIFEGTPKNNVVSYIH